MEEFFDIVQFTVPLFAFWLQFLFSFMILTVDIGNSRTKFGMFDGGQLVRKFVIETIRAQSAESIFETLRSAIPDLPQAIIVSSVVKELDKTYLDLSNDFLRVKPQFIDHTLDLGFEIKYEPREDCGSDRLVGAFSAIEQYGAPCIICSFGTATTIDIVNQEREYLGGIITPGIGTLASALFEKTSKLPHVELSKPKSVIGNSTVNSISSGIYFGYIGLVDGIIKRMIDESGSKPLVISTGGFAELIAEESEYVET
ncbi:MAG: type III pantothenate kinase, partial [Acidobacteria bacterium]|nr:type III pantothenate kinase [Acidobacteriota bacterium]